MFLQGRRATVLWKGFMVVVTLDTDTWKKELENQRKPLEAEK